MVRRGAVGVAWLCIHCGEAPPAMSTPDAATTVDLRCAIDRAAAVPDGRGGVECIPVGARGGGGAAMWPDVTSAAGVRYVRGDAAPGGDGTRERPFRRLAEALEGAPAGTSLALAAGTLPIDVETRVTAAVDIVGAGVERCTLALPTRSTAIAWEAHGGSLRGVTLARDAAQTAADADVALDLRDGASLAVEDVAIRRAGIAVQVGAARLRASHLDVVSSGRNGVRLLTGAWASLVSFSVSLGANAGVTADGAHLHLREGLIDHNAAHGLSLLRAPPTLGGSERCEGEPSPDAPGVRDCVSRVSIQCNGIAGVYLDGARTLDARGVAVWGTRRVSGTTGGDGVYAQGGARLLLDADRAEGDASGQGSYLGANERVGLLLDGAGTTVSARGTRAERNASGGMFVQSSAEATEVLAGDFRGNGAVGIAVSRGASLRTLRATTVSDTRAALVSAIGATGPVTLMLADGVSVASGSVVARGNRFDRNARFGAVFFQADGELDGNTGRGNRYGIQAWSSTLRGLDTNSIEGTEAAPRERVPVVDGAGP